MKAQIETMGLVMIVIILVFLALFSLPFIIKEKSKALDENYLQLVSNNLRSSVLNTNICGAATVKEEILNCESDFPICLNDCSELPGFIRNVIDSSLGSFEGSVNYVFLAGDMNISSGECFEKIVSSKAFIDDIGVSVEICYRR